MYIASVGSVLLLTILGFAIDSWQQLFFAMALFGVSFTALTLFATWYIYDRSPLYELEWLEHGLDQNARVLVIHSGFDELSTIIDSKFKPKELDIVDFYDPIENPEPSIARARKIYPSDHSTTLQLESPEFPSTGYTHIFFFFAAHEIREENTRIRLFSALKEVMAPEGKLFVTEHLRDVNNYAIYAHGALHFLSQKTWNQTFVRSELTLVKHLRITPFVHNFTLCR